MEGRPFASAVDLIACASALGVLGIAFTGFRIYSKLVIFGRLKLDDWLAIVGVVLFVFHSICVGYSSRFGADFHTEIVSPEDYHVYTTFPTYFVIGLLNSWTATVVKWTIVLWFIRIGVDVWFKKACYTLLGFLLAIAVASTPAITFACTPIQAQWDEVNYPVANCSRIAPTYTTVVALFVATDILVVILPFYLMVDCAHSSAKKNLQLAFAFLLASLSCVGGMMKLYYVCTVRRNVPATSRRWINSRGIMWTEIELAMGLISSCLPSIYAHFRRRKAYLFTRSSATVTHTRAGGKKNKTRIYNGPNAPKHIYAVEVEHGTRIRNGSAGTEEEGIIYQQRDFKMEFDNRSRCS